MFAGIPLPLLGQEDPYHAGRFKVILDRVTFAVFTECTLPSLSMEPTKVQEGGQNAYVHKLPTRVEVGTLKLRYGLCRSSDILIWYLDVMRGRVDLAMADIVVMMVDGIGLPLAAWTFKDAYPIKWTGPTLKAGESAVAIEEIEFAFSSFGVNGSQAE